MDKIMIYSMIHQNYILKLNEFIDQCIQNKELFQNILKDFHFNDSFYLLII
jgi:hypothetical protein